MISSKDNEIIKLAYKIKDKKYSKKYGLAFVETIKVIKELYDKKLLDRILVRDDKLSLVSHLKDINIDVVSDQISQYLSDSTTSDGVFGICKIQKNAVEDYSRCLILDGIQDPSNIGAIIRSARAFNFNTILAINSVYPYTYKCIRSSMSYIFDINYIDTTYNHLLDLKKKYKIKIVAADMSGIEVKEKYNDNLAIVIGNEGNGISNEMKNISDIVVKIPMANKVESLNASVSAGILMYLLK